MFEITTLSNGVRVALETIPFVRSVSFGIWVLNGSKNETAATSGMSHFIEHMLFKGTENRTAKAIADEMDAIGGQLNAYTTKEYTCYHARVLDTHLEKAVDVLSDMFFRSTFAEVEIGRERNVILEEIAMYEDNPEDVAHDSLQSMVWADSPLGRPILGTESSIAGFAQEDFKRYMAQNYRTDNTVIAIAGNFESGKVMALLERVFAAFPKPDSDAYDTPPNMPIVYKSGTVAASKDVEQLHMCIGFPGITVGSEDAYVLAAMNTYFGGGMSSRLFQSLREEHGLVYSIYSYNESYLDAGVFHVYAALNPTQAKAAMGLIRAEINDLLGGGMTAEALEKAKEQLKSNYLLSLESSSSRMSSIGRSTLLMNRILSPDELIQRIDAVDLAHVNALAQKIFVPEQMSISAAGSLKGIDVKELIANV